MKRQRNRSRDSSPPTTIRVRRVALTLQADALELLGKRGEALAASHDAVERAARAPNRLASAFARLAQWRLAENAGAVMPAELRRPLRRCEIRSWTWRRCMLAPGARSTLGCPTRAGSLKNSPAPRPIADTLLCRVALKHLAWAVKARRIRTERPIRGLSFRNWQVREGYLLITGSELNAFVPINLRAVAAILVVDTSRMVPRMPARAGKDIRPSVPMRRTSRWTGHAVECVWINVPFPSRAVHVTVAAFDPSRFAIANPV